MYIPRPVVPSTVQEVVQTDALVAYGGLDVTRQPAQNVPSAISEPNKHHTL